MQETRVGRIALSAEALAAGFDFCLGLHSLLLLCFFSQLPAHHSVWSNLADRNQGRTWVGGPLVRIQYHPRQKFPDTFVIIWRGPAILRSKNNVP